MQKHLAETGYIRRKPERARQECRRSQLGSITTDTPNGFPAVQNHFPIALADEPAELRQRRSIDRIAFFPGLQSRRRAFIPVRRFSSLLENFIVGPDQCFCAEEVVYAWKSRRQRQMMF